MANLVIIMDRLQATDDSGLQGVLQTALYLLNALLELVSLVRT
jgi:hypothetical protein